MNKNDKGFARRIIALGILIALVLTLFIARLAQFQLIEGAGANEAPASASAAAFLPAPGAADFVAHSTTFCPANGRRG